MRVPTLTPQFLDRADEYYADTVGVIADDGTAYTYGEVVDRVNRLSNALLDLDVQPGDRVATVSPNTHWNIEATFAIQQLGAIFVPLNDRLIADDYEYLLSDSGASVALVDHEYVETIDAVRDDVSTETFVGYEADGTDDVWLDYETLLTDSSPTQPDRPDMSEDDPATINYTSGTTGAPKGAVRTHRTDVWNAVMHAFNAEVKDDVTYLWTLPMFHVNGWGSMYHITGFGGTHVCLREFDAETVFERIRAYDVSYLSGAPTVLNRLLEYNQRHDDLETQGSRPVTISTAGAPPPEATIQSVEDDFGWELIHFYGHTESGPYTTSHAPKRIEQRGRLTIKPKQGLPQLGNELRVVDADGEDVPRDDETIGEVVLKGNLVFDRYWNNPTATEEAFHDRVDGWFHSGDLGTLDEDGFLTLKDRKKDIIISGGENISSVELEDVIYALDGVAKATVIPIPHDEWGETPKALVVTTPDADLTENDVLEHCRDQLASYKVPSIVEFVDDLPETATGKIKKHELREDHWAGEERLIG